MCQLVYVMQGTSHDIRWGKTDINNPMGMGQETRQGKGEKERREDSFRPLYSHEIIGYIGMANEKKLFIEWIPRDV